jgi:excisionase family DNA binding protein
MYTFGSDEEFIDYLSGNIINTNEAAGLLGCSRQYVDKIARQGKLRTVKTYPTNKLFLRSDVLKWLKR